MARKPKSERTGRIKQIGQAYQITKRADRWIGLILLGTFLAAFALGTAVFWFIPPAWPVADVILGVMIGILGVLIVFGRRATRSQIKQIEGQPGAAVAVLRVLRRGWRTDQAIAFTRQQDVIHRLVGPPGIVLIGEGNPHRLKQLMTSERSRHQRVTSETPVHEIIIGDGEGQVPLGKLTRHVTKMKRQIKPAEMTEVLYRLKAMDATRSAVPLPKGPIPTNMKGLRSQMRGNPRGGR
jgi:hypothetical protein